ncbi:MAG: protein kinase [Anaerolineae bacterium CG_4_9_14_3_um_filter_57_17]|nr:PQQ-binding-like beta-propeller repeat protein [bacterium]NCT21413.1 PQQ-binding-like beta-propeller repeat protein [bacterium]OIO83172.1 MAG: protein kinase [Anaerolineae bacterium CG2_30_57_67]PJB67394.1 MAG: protein kinase [Anaerolineae bacterium CG_4_9_14_3_um_filter_57_17]
METKHIDGSVGIEKRTTTGQLASGTNLGNRYVVQEVIGVGGMGSVYRARDLHFPNVVKLVAVKEMINQAPDPLVRQTIVQNFEREANILATLSHPSIPRIYDYFTLENRSYLVLEFINGKDLETVLAQSEGFLPEEQVLAWGIELCDVIAFLHGHKPDPIIFRDMKPSNVMINQHNHIILVDFGIAKSFQVGQKGTMIGTEGYSPPEQYRGEANTQADIYALGATMHHLLTRRDPRLEAPFSFAERPVRKINPNVSIEIEAVINTALQYNASDRFKRIEDFKSALMSAGKKTGMLQHVAPVAPVIQAGGIKPIWTFQCEDEIRGSSMVYNGAVYTGCYDNNLYALNAATGEFIWKYAAEGGIVSRPAAYEDIVYFGSEDHRVHAVSARSGKVAWMYYTDDRVRSSPRVAEGHLFIGSDDKFLHAINLTTGRRAWTFDTGAEIRGTPFVINDLVFFGNEAGDFFALNFHGQIKWRYKAKRNITSSPWVQDNVAYFNSMDGYMYALDARTGFLLWRFRMDKPSIVSPIVNDGIIFTGSADGYIYAVEAKSAKEIWRYKTEHQVNGSPVIYRDALYCGSVDGNLYCLEYRTGRLRWKFATKGPITAAPLAYDDIIYVGSHDHYIYALLA